MNPTALAMQKALSKSRRPSSSSAAVITAAFPKPSAQEIALAKVAAATPPASTLSRKPSASSARSKPQALVPSAQQPEPRHLIQAVAGPSPPPSFRQIKTPPATSRTPSPPRRTHGPVTSATESATEQSPPLIRRIAITVVVAILSAFFAFLASTRIVEPLFTLPSEAVGQLAIGDKSLQGGLATLSSKMIDTTGLREGTMAELVQRYNAHLETMHLVWTGLGAVLGLLAGGLVSRH